MRASRTSAAWIAAPCLAGCLGGCLERIESITIEPDGTVLIEAVFETDQPGELYEGDAIPSDAGGWLVDESQEIDDDGRTHYRLVAEGVFGPGVELPESYAVPGDPDAPLYLRFPTTVVIDYRPDAVYYHFHRRYPGRAWAHIEALRELLIDEKTRHLKDTDEKDLTREDRTLLVRSYTDFESAKLLTFARGAFLKTSPDLPQDSWLEVIAAFRELQGELDLDAIAEIMELEDDDEREEAIAKEVDSWREKSFTTLQSALRDFCGYDSRHMKTFLRLYEARLKDFDVTSGLGDDVFQITVEMPGEIVGSNSDSTSRDRATWKFSGRRFRDRDVELMVSSRLEYGVSEQ